MPIEKLISHYLKHNNPYFAAFSGIGMGSMTILINSELDITAIDLDSAIAGTKQAIATGLTSGYTAKLAEKLSNSDSSPYLKSIIYPTLVSTIAATIAHYTFLESPEPMQSVGFVAAASTIMTGLICAYHRDEYQVKKAVTKVKDLVSGS